MRLDDITSHAARRTRDRLSFRAAGYRSELLLAFGCFHSRVIIFDLLKRLLIKHFRVLDGSAPTSKS